METEELPELLKNEHLRQLPFRVPEGYFTQLISDIDKRIEPIEIPEWLKEDTVWQVPEGYFAQLEAEIGQKLDNEIAKENAKVVTIWSHWYNWVAAASVAIIVFFAIQATYQRTPVQPAIPELTAEDITQYLLENPRNFHPEMQSWLAAQDGNTLGQEWLEHIDYETLETQLENYDDEILAN
jgi:hypothetical protein